MKVDASILPSREPLAVSLAAVVAVTFLVAAPALANPFSRGGYRPRNESRQEAPKPSPQVETAAPGSVRVSSTGNTGASSGAQVTRVTVTRTAAAPMVAAAAISPATAPPAEESKPKKKGGLFSLLFGSGSSSDSRDKSKNRNDVATAIENNPQYRPYPNAVQMPTHIDDLRLATSTGSNTRVIIDIARQRAYLLVDGQVAIDAPISTARTGKFTPRGTFQVTERVRTGKISTIYDVSMPYWMRLNHTVFGVHAGYLPGHPASAGCVRLPVEAAEKIFDHTRSGTTVEIRGTWEAAPETGLVGQPVRLVYKVQA